MTSPLREHALRTPDADSSVRRSMPLAPVVQRKCGCGGSCGSCSEQKKKVQRRALGDTSREVPESVGSILGSAGRPLDDETRMSMESRFGRSFADVRVHTDTHAAESAREISAAAYTSGTHIVFGAGRFAPQTPTGRRLLAHELAHVVQQRSGTAPPSGIGPADDAHERAADRAADAVVAQGPAFVPPPVLAPAVEAVVRRKREEGETPAEEEARRLIVEDSASPAPGQMRRKEFVAELDAVICETSRQEMGRLGRSSDGCPLLDQWRPRIRKMDARQLEVSMRRWVDGDSTVRTAGDYIPAVATRLARSIRIWGATGQVVGVPPDLMDLLGGGKIRVGVGSLIRGAVGSLFRKARDGASAPAGGVVLDAGAGRPLEIGVASRMGRAFGRDFSDVRIHTGADAGAAAAQVNARAFTIGNDIAFAGGEYAPGTIVGDALLAHELAHVAQQDGAAGGVLTKSDDAGSALEHDADNAAVHAVTSLWPSVGRFARGLRTNAMPRLKSSLKLQRCGPNAKEKQDYLTALDQAKGPVASEDAAKKARAVVEEWADGSPDTFLTNRRKILLIRQMLGNGPTEDDQEQILNLLERTETADLKAILTDDGIKHADLLDKFTGDWMTQLWRFYMRRYPSAYKNLSSAFDSVNDAEPAPRAPDRELLKSAEPTGDIYKTVQFGDKLPEHTKLDKVETKRSMEKLRGPEGRDTARKWVEDVYGDFVTEKRKKAVASAEYVAVTGKTWQKAKDYCLAGNKPASLTEQQWDDYCEDQQLGTEGMYDRAENKIYIHTARDTPETMLHEVIHGYAHDNVRTQLKQFAVEGLTEFLTRRVVLRRKESTYIGGYYDDSYDAMQELAVRFGEDLLARVHFQGKVSELCNALGKAEFDEWNSLMDSSSGGAAATKVVRRETKVKPSTEKCK